MDGWSPNTWQWIGIALGAILLVVVLMDAVLPRVKAWLRVDGRRLDIAGQEHRPEAPTRALSEPVPATAAPATAAPATAATAATAAPAAGCLYPGCREHKLVMTCDWCSQCFCHRHRFSRDHGCPEIRKNTRSALGSRPADSAAVTTADRRPIAALAPRPAVAKTPPAATCPYPGCRETRLSHRCNWCKLEFCKHHRFAEDHGCVRLAASASRYVPPASAAELARAEAAAVRAEQEKAFAIAQRVDAERDAEHAAREVAREARGEAARLAVAMALSRASDLPDDCTDGGRSLLLVLPNNMRITHTFAEDATALTIRDVCVSQALERGADTALVDRLALGEFALVCSQPPLRLAMSDEAR